MLNAGAELFKGVPGSQGAKASRLEISQAFVSQICAGKKIPGEELRHQIRAAYGVPPEAWDRPCAPADPPQPTTSPKEAPVASSLDAELPRPSDGRTVLERARDLLGYLAVPRASQLELAQAREIRAALTLEARLVGAMATKAQLHEHPDFATWVEQLVHALASVPGALDVLEQSLTSSDERRAAA